MLLFFELTENNKNQNNFTITLEITVNKFIGKEKNNIYVICEGKECSPNIEILYFFNFYI